MDEQYKEINKMDELRHNLTKLAESISVGKNARNYVANHPVSSLACMLLLGFLTAILSGGIIRLILFLISFGLRAAAFIFVARQTLAKVSSVLKKKKKEK